MSLITFNPENATFKKWNCLVSRFRIIGNYTSLFNKISMKNPTLIKAFTASAMFILIGSLASAQCSNFKLNNSSNPLKGFSVSSGLESRPFFIDIDGDGDLDCFSGEYNINIKDQSKVYFFRNGGTNAHPSFKKINGASNPLDKVSIPVLTIPYFIDIDADGDYDCFIGDGTSGAIRYYKNVGTAINPSFEKQSAAMNPLSMVKLSAQSMAEPAFADIDGDGDLDCLVTDLYGDEYYYKNTGTAKQPLFEHITGKSNPFEFLKEMESNGPSFYDWNHDGLQDLFMGTDYYKNIGTKTEPAFEKNESEGPNFSSGSFLLPIRWVTLSSKNSVCAITGTAAGTFNFHTTAPEVSITPKDKQTIAAGSSITLHISPEITGYTYQWVKDGKAVKGATANQLTVNKPGNYSLEVSGSCGNVSTNTTYINTRGTSIDAAVSENVTAENPLLQVQAYPNPTKDEFIVNLPAGLSNASTIRIVNLLGKIMQTQKVSSGVLKFGKELSAGIYFMQIIDADKLIYQQKLIKE